MNALYADIVVDIALQKLDRHFTYLVPDSMRDEIRIGSLVSVPFGGGSRYVKGYVIGFSDTTDIPVEKLREVDSLLTDESTIDSDLLALAIRMKELYGGTLSQSLKVVLPVKKNTKMKKRELVVLSADLEVSNEKLAVFEKKNQKARLRLLSELISEKVIPKEIITSKLNVNSAVIKALSEMDLCVVVSEDEYSEKLSDNVSNDDIILNSEQRCVVDGVLSDYHKKTGGVSLLHGITGSGKTEVYIEIVSEVVKSNQQAIVLIPEIALSYQTLMRFYKRFGKRVRTIHSRLSEGERCEIFKQARQGLIDVVIGPRSALFTPFSSLGIIIIDEEHESSYKSEKTPKYHARVMAMERAKLEGIPLLLGSATPSVDSYYAAKSGEIKLYELKMRAAGAKLPEVISIDLKDELKSGNRSMFSRTLLEAIDERLRKHEQTLLFINRRGVSGFVSCRSCGFVYKCPHCDVSLSLHGKDTLSCHYCGYSEKYNKICPECGSKFIGTMKSGTEAVEKSLSDIFKEAKILRMDADTTKEKDSYEKILSSFANHEADILIGTQMIVKGHDFPAVTLVGILMADMSLYSGDYRSSERTFQLLTQCAGRAGRRENDGLVIIQTYSPQNEIIEFSKAQDYESFYNSEIAFRKLMSYPPAGHMMVILFEDKSESLLDKYCERIYNVISNSLHHFDRTERVSVIGPSKTTISYINDVHRRVLYIKAAKYDTLIRLKDAIEKYVESIERKGDKILPMQFDFDPMDGY